MNSGINALGQGNRANATIGRALNLIIRNVGGGRPGELSRSTLGGPHKYSFCFAEDESDPEWTPLSVARGLLPQTDAITFFQGDGIQAFIDQRSELRQSSRNRLPWRSLPSVILNFVSLQTPSLSCRPSTTESLRDAGWDRTRIESELHKAMVRPCKDLCIRRTRCRRRNSAEAEPMKWSTSSGPRAS